MSELKIGFAGLGAVATRCHLPVLKRLPEVRVVAGAERNPQQAERVQKRFDIPQVFASYGEMYDQADMDAVYVCLPSHLHCDAVRKALEKGCHVFCEKPMGLSSEEAWQMARLADKKSVVLMPGYNMRFIENIQRAREIVQSRVLGQILQIQGLFANPGPYNSWDPKSDWYLDPRNYGVLFDNGCHLVDLLHYVTGSRICQVQSRSLTTLRGCTVPDNIVCHCEWENGALGTLNLAWRTARFTVLLQIHGTAGALSVGPYYLEYLHPAVDLLDRMITYLRNAWVVFANGVRGALQGSMPDRQYVLEGENFVQAVIKGHPPRTAAKEAVEVLEVLEAIKDSLVVHA